MTCEYEVNFENFLQLEEEARVSLCKLVLACVERRSADLQEISKEIAGPLHRFLPLLLSPSFALMVSLFLSHSLSLSMYICMYVCTYNISVYA